MTRRKPSIGRLPTITAIAVTAWGLCWSGLSLSGAEHPPLSSNLRAGTAAVVLDASDDMIIGGSILGRTSAGQDGQLRAVAIVVEGPDGNRIAIAACDVLMMQRDLLDSAAARIEQATGIPFANILINCTHTHHAPTTCTVHGYQRDEAFSQQVQKAVVDAVLQADEHCRKSGPAAFSFRLGQEATVGQNSRMLLSDGAISWSGDRDDAIRPTGPFDPDLPVLAFRRSEPRAGMLIGLIYGHATHTIGTRTPGARSPAFYGLAAQELESEFGGTVLFLEGASGSTHNWSVAPDEAVIRMKAAVRDALARALPVSVDSVAALKREITVRVRSFDEAKEDAAVAGYCMKRLGEERGRPVIDVFRNMRKELAPQQGQARMTWVQAMRIGDVAIVGVPAEFFTVLGIEIKRRSPFRYTVVAELANDWIGYVPDEEAYDFGGYQVWTGLHSWVARGTGEQIVDTAVELLEELAAGRK